VGLDARHAAGESSDLISRSEVGALGPASGGEISISFSFGRSNSSTR